MLYLRLCVCVVRVRMSAELTKAVGFRFLWDCSFKQW